MIDPFFLIYLFILAVTAREGETQRACFHLPAHAPDGHHSQGVTRLQLGTRGFFRVCHTNAGAQAPRLSSASFSAYEQGAGLEPEHLRHTPVPTQDAGTAGGQLYLTCYDTSPEFTQL